MSVEMGDIDVENQRLVCGLWCRIIGLNIRVEKKENLGRIKK